MRIDYDHDEETAIRGLLVGHSVAVDGDALVLDNGTRLVIHPNEGCGGCNSGWYKLESLGGCENAITAVHFEEYGERESDEDNDAETPEHFRIFVYAEGIKSGVELLHVSGDEGNGYYGRGYSIEVTYPSQQEA